MDKIVDLHGKALGHKALKKPLTLDERQEMIAKLEDLFGQIFDTLKVDWRNDPNMRETPFRVSKMYVNELLVGRFDAPPAAKDFENIEQYDQLMTLSPIPIKSLCAHHLLPIKGTCLISVLYGKDSELLGVSKYARIVEYFSRRFHLQEALVQQIADFIEQHVKPLGVAVRIEAEHYCMTFRGIEVPESKMVSTALRGLLLTDPSVRQEYLTECIKLK